MPDTLDPIVADGATAGGILAALKLARWCITNEIWFVGRDAIPPVFYAAMRMVRGLVWDAVDDCVDCNRSQDHADAIAEALGNAGVQERANAIEHLRRARSDSAAYELNQAVCRQLTGAIVRLTAAMAESRKTST